MKNSFREKEKKKKETNRMRRTRGKTLPPALPWYLTSRPQPALLEMTTSTEQPSSEVVTLVIVSSVPQTTCTVDDARLPSHSAPFA